MTTLPELAAELGLTEQDIYLAAARLIRRDRRPIISEPRTQSITDDAERAIRHQYARPARIS